MVEIKDINWGDKPKKIRRAAEDYIERGELGFFDTLEPYFLEANGFVAGKTFDCDYNTRRLIFNSFMTEYYCTPCKMSPAFTIRQCANIERAELITENVGQLIPRMGDGPQAFKGLNIRNQFILTVRLYTRKSDDPIVDINVLSTPLARNNEYFPLCMENAKKIYWQFMQIAEANKGKRGAASGTDDTLDTVEKIRKFKELFDEGILTEEEFEAKKRQLLGI